MTTNKELEELIKDLQHFHIVNSVKWGGFLIADGVKYEKTYSNIITLGLSVAEKILSTKFIENKKVRKLSKKLIRKASEQITFQLSMDDTSKEDEIKNLIMLEKLCSLSHKLVALVEKEINFSTFSGV